MQGVVILVVIIIMNKTVLPEQKEEPGTWKSRDFTKTTRRSQMEPTRAHVLTACSLTSNETDPVTGHRSLCHLLSSHLVSRSVGTPVRPGCISPDRWLPAEHTDPTGAAHGI